MLRQRQNAWPFPFEQISKKGAKRDRPVDTTFPDSSLSQTIPYYYEECPCQVLNGKGALVGVWWLTMLKPNAELCTQGVKWDASLIPGEGG